MQTFLQGKTTERKCRLLACGCCRRLWDLLVDKRSRNGVEATEWFSEGLIDETDLRQAGQGAYQAWLETPSREYDHHLGQAQFIAANAIVRLTGTGDAWKTSFESATAELRSAVWFASAGDQLAAVNAEGKTQCELVRELFGNPFRPVTIRPAWLSFADGLVVKLVQGIHEERAFEQMPGLVDALCDAGCEDEQILGHCRGPGPHVLGCWLIDRLLAKESP